jgi:hypothetical protein
VNENTPSDESPADAFSPVPQGYQLDSWHYCHSFQGLAELEESDEKTEEPPLQFHIWHLLVLQLAVAMAIAILVGFKIFGAVLLWGDMWPELCD